jgi:hypothetical protein
MNRALTAAAVLIALASAGVADAQTRTPQPRPAPPICDPLNLIPGCQPSAEEKDPFANITQDLLNKILADVTYAKALAKASNNQVTLACWSAWVDLVTAQTKPVTDDAGNALSQPDPHFFTTAERASEFINQLQPNSSLNIGCGAALNQSKMAIGQMVGAVLSGGALGLFKVPGL